MEPSPNQYPPSQTPAANQQPLQQVNFQQGRNPGLAVVLELLPGLTIQTFGIGNIYAGRVGTGIALMVGYWILTGVNILLCFMLIGFITWPLTWLLFMIFAPISANTAANNWCPDR
jgi:TM2 domain-containing membrane protein YozV